MPILAEDKAWADSFMPLFDNWQIAGVEGVYGVPSEFYAVGLYNNKEFFEKAGVEQPKTMEEFYAVSEKFKSMGLIPMAIGNKDNYRAGHLMNNLVMKMFGFEKVKALADRTAKYTDADMVELFKVMYDMNNNGYLGANIVSVDYNTEKELFFRGESAMHMDGSWFLGELPGSEIEDKVGFVPFPYFADKPQFKDSWMGGAAGGMSLAANTTPERQAAAIKLLKYLTSVEHFNYVQQIMKGSIYPVKMEADPSIVSPLTIDVVNAINTAKDMKTDVPTLITLSHEIQGVTRMLQEGGRQFDIIDSAADFARYKVLVLPDTIPVNDALAQKLAEYIGDGGAVVASFESGLNVRKDRVAFSQLGIRLEQELTTDLDGVPVRGRSFEKADYAEYIRPGAAIRTGLLDTAYVMCSKGLEIYTVGEVEVLGEIHASYFDRTYQHFCSHRSTPCSGKRKQAGIVKNGSVIYFSNPIFTQYYVNAPRWDRQLFLNALDLLLPSPVLRHNGPSTLLTAVNEQAAEKRYVVHLLHYIPERRSAEMDVIEDVIPLYQIELELNLPRHISRVTLVPEEQALEFERVGNKISVTVPKVNGHAMLCLDYS